jgi:hypothetical protein
MRRGYIQDDGASSAESSSQSSHVLNRTQMTLFEDVDASAGLKFA